MNLNIKYYSQYSEKIEKDWQSRSCAIVCLQMVLDFYKKESKPIDLIKEGLFISEDLEKRGRRTEGYTREFGWGHELLVTILRNHGLPAYKQDFRSIKFNLDDSTFSNSGFESEIFEFGINKIRENLLNNKPVIVSIVKDTLNKKTSGHMVVVSGLEEKNGEVKGFYIKDPEIKDNSGSQDDFIDIEKFINIWKKLAIFVN